MNRFTGIEAVLAVIGPNIENFHLGTDALLVGFILFGIVNFILNRKGLSWIMTLALYITGVGIFWLYWNGYWITNPMIGVFVASVVGFTQNQRAWVLRRDGSRCQFHYNVGGVWVRCRNTQNLQVHHIVPRGWAARHFPHKFPINGSLNAITLCDQHHIGDVDCEDSIYVVHPDTAKAKREYREGNKGAYNDMMKNRRELNEKGVPYWNTRWDWMFNRIAKKQTAKYTKSNPDDKYPKNGRRGNNGREPKGG